MRNAELGDSIRAWRDRRDPAAAGPPAGARRRAPGLRREEIVSDPHAAVGTYPEDERLAALVAELRATSEDFERHWAGGEIATRAASRKVVDHPEVGPILLDCDVLTARASDLRLVVYSAAPGTEDAEKLALLGVVGLQRMAG